MDTPAIAVAWYLTLSAVLFALYGRDKRAARDGLRRAPETTLQLLALLGGWPGALLGQRVYHHKTKKRSFQLVFWSAVVANSAVLAWFALR